MKTDIEALEEIKKAEEESAKKLEEADLTAKRLIEQAQHEAKQIAELADKEAQEEYDNVMKNAETAAKSKNMAIANESKAKISSIKEVDNEKALLLFKGAINKLAVPK